jgi:glycosyltransferase involved in cell wall biosynthesis
MAMFTYLMVISPKDNPIKLSRCLKSLENQNGSLVDFLIVKNGPIPQILEEELYSFSKTSKIKIDIKSTPDVKNLGLALNGGLEKIHSEWVLRIDPDDIVLENRIEAAKNLIGRTNFDVAFFSSYEIGLEKDLIYLKELNVDFPNNKFFVNNPFTHSTALIRTSSLRELGGYRDIYLAEDYDLWLRFYINKKIIKTSQEFVLIYDAENLFTRRRTIMTVKGELSLFRLRKEIGKINILFNLFILSIRILYRILPIFLSKNIYFHFILKEKKFLNIGLSKMLIKKYKIILE